MVSKIDVTVAGCLRRYGTQPVIMMAYGFAGTMEHDIERFAPAFASIRAHFGAQPTPPRNRHRVVPPTTVTARFRLTQRGSNKRHAVDFS